MNTTADFNQIDHAAASLAAMAEGGPVNASKLQGSVAQDFFGFYESMSGSRVTGGNARSIEPVFSAINLLTSSLSTLPMSLLDTSQGRRHVSRKHWTHYLVHTEPYPLWTPARFFGAFYINALLWGNAAAYINRAGRRLEIMPWHRVDHQVSRGRYDRYVIGDVAFDAVDVLHLQAPSIDGKNGDSPVAMCARALGVTMSAEQFAEKFYRQASGVAGHIETDKEIEWPEGDRKTFIEGFNKLFSGLVSAGKTGILPPGSKYQDHKPPQREAQHVETALHQTRVVARIFNVPPHKLGDDAKTSYSSIEQEQIRYVVDGLRPWLVRIDQEFTLKLLTPESRRKGLKFNTNVSALLRGDEKTRADVHKTYVGFGGKTINEIREKEDLDPVEGGDQILVPANNMQPLVTLTADGNLANNLAPLFMDACKRLSSKETNAVRREWDRQQQNTITIDELESKLDAFYDRHEQHVNEALQHIGEWIADRFDLDLAQVKSAIDSTHNRQRTTSAAKDQTLGNLLNEWSADQGQSIANAIAKNIQRLQLNKEIQNGIDE